MSILSIRFANNFYTASEAQAPVEVIGRTGIVDRRPMTLGRGVDVDLQVGSYIVRLFLPSGEIVSDQVEIKGDAASVHLHSAQESPQESLAWAYYLKGAKRDALFPGKYANKKFEDPRPAPQLRVWQYHPNALSRGWDASNAAYSLTEDRTPAVLDQRLRSVATVRCPEGVQSWLQIQYPGSPSKFVAVTGVGDVGVMIRQGEKPSPSFDPLTIFVQTQNQHAEAILNYLMRGAFADATTVGIDFLKEAETLLQNKVANPFGAAIGGYFLLRAGRVSQFRQWVANLDLWIDWLPDGAVIHAWHLRQLSQVDLAQFRYRLLQAERRGLPMFTQGVRLLYDGLRSLNRLNESDFEVEQALVRQSDYAAALDWSAPTTTFYADHPEKPLQQLPTTV